MENKLARIEELKREKGVVILAHYYCRPEAQKVADFLGDSLALSAKAQYPDALVVAYVNTTVGVKISAAHRRMLCWLCSLSLRIRQLSSLTLRECTEEYISGSLVSFPTPILMNLVGDGRTLISPLKTELRVCLG